MKAAAFGVVRAESLEEAIHALAEHGDEARVIAGGQSLVPMMALRLASPSVLVDLARVPGLAAVTVGATGLRISAMARQRDVERDARVARHAPLLAGALPHIGHVAIRNRGTVCGSLAHADPAAELPTVALAADAELRLRSAEGARTMAASDFFTGYYSTAVRATEIVEAVELPTIGVRTGTAFVEVSRRHGDFALVGVAAVLRLDSAGAVEHVRLAVSGVASTPQRIAAAESLLLGAPPVPDVVEEAAAAVRAEVDPGDDLHATAAYRRHVAGVLTARALRLAAERAAA